MADIIEYRWTLGPPQPIPQLQIQLPQQQPIPPPDIPFFSLPQEMREVALRLHTQTQAPLGMIVVCMLGVMALACQDLFDVAPRKDLRFCISLFIMVLAESGERKTTVDRILFKSVREFERNLDAQHKEEMEAYDIAHYQCRIERQVREKAYAKAVSKNQDVEASKKALADCLRMQPKRPVRKRLIINDATKAAVKLELGKEESPSLVLLSDEAGSILKGELFNDSPFLNTLWSGQPIEVDRATSEGFRIEDERFGIMLQLQPDLLPDYLKKKGKIARASGFLARTLFCKAISTIGRRFDPPVSQFQVDDEILHWFHQQVKKRLEMALKRRESKQERLCLTFSPEAAARWEREKNNIEMASGPNGHLKEFRDVASKHPEQIARIAGVLHGFTTEGTVISDSTMMASINMANYFLNSFITLNTDKSLPEEAEDAILLENWLCSNHFKFNYLDIPKNLVLKLGPNRLRTRERLNRALEQLQFNNAINIYKHGRTSYIRLFQRVHANQTL